MRPSRRLTCSGRAGAKACSETRTLNSGKVASMRSVSIEVSLPPSCRFAVRLPAAGSDAVFGDIASALAMSVTLICTSPESVPSVATLPLPSMRQNAGRRSAHDELAVADGDVDRRRRRVRRKIQTFQRGLVERRFEHELRLRRACPRRSS